MLELQDLVLKNKLLEMATWREDALEVVVQMQWLLRNAGGGDKQREGRFEGSCDWCGGCEYEGEEE